LVGADVDKAAREAAAELSGRWLYAAIQAAGISQEELARRVGISSSNLSKYVNSRQCCNLPALLTLLGACGFEIKELRCIDKATKACKGFA
jgi:transcriptional regulator with XRE-family HTH domain